MKVVLEIRSLTMLIFKTSQTWQNSVNQLRNHWEEGDAGMKTRGSKFPALGPP